MPKKQSPRIPTSWYVLFPLIFLAGLFSGYLLWGNRTGKSGLPEAATSDDPALGPTDAPVTIVMFSDYQCPYCKLWHDEVLPLILQEYGTQVRYIYRDYPLAGHQEALPAARAANCAGDQGAYWPFHDALFSNRAGFGRQAYLQYAQELGLDLQAFQKCLDSTRHEDEVLGDFRDGLRLGVNSTPTFFVNGTRVVGAQPFSIFKQLIEAELAQNR